jgi:hypothetical protein
MTFSVFELPAQWLNTRPRSDAMFNIAQSLKNQRCYSFFVPLMEHTIFDSRPRTKVLRFLMAPNSDRAGS